MAFTPESRPFTTVGHYGQEGCDVEGQGSVNRWTKHHDWERFMELPTRTRQGFEMALMHSTASDRVRPRAAGWQLVPSLEMSLDVFGAYPRYIHTSRAEFTVAKDQNVRLRSGWFSERTVCYLASGKPVGTQDTGFSNVLPTAEGLFAIDDIDGAVDAVEWINGDYRRHCEVARAIAGDCFDGARVAEALPRAVGLS
jgi:hypothetical protein